MDEQQRGSAAGLLNRQVHVADRYTPQVSRGSIRHRTLRRESRDLGKIVELAVGTNRPNPRSPAMRPSTDYIRHAARLARKFQLEAATGSPPQPGEEFYKTLHKALEEIAAGLEMVSTRE